MCRYQCSAEARGDLVAIFLVFGLGGDFARSRVRGFAWGSTVAGRGAGGEREGSDTVRKTPCFAGFLTRFRVPGC